MPLSNAEGWHSASGVQLAASQASSIVFVIIRHAMAYTVAME